MRSKTFLIAVAATLAAQFATAQSQSWEKLIVPGLSYRMEVDFALPRVIHAFRYVPGSGKVYSEPELAGSQVFMPDDDTKGREPLTRTMESMGALAGVNADFFPWTGDPIGMMVRKGELISLPYQKRSSFSWGSGYFVCGPVETTLALQLNNSLKTIDLLNAEVGDNQLGLFTPVAASARSSVDGIYAVLSTEDVLKPSGVVQTKVELITPDLKSAAVKPGQMVLVGTGNQKGAVSSLSIGQSLSIRTVSQGVDFTKALHTIGGGPRLISGGKPAMDLVAEGIQPSFSTTMHPRTAIGSTKEGDIWFVVVEGRQAMSRGATLDELTAIMQGLGCVEAMNLDGGGSSTLALGGLVVNRPSDKGIERAICNSLMLFGELPEPAPDTAYVIKGSPKVPVGSSASFAVIDSKGERVSLSKVIWAAQGSAWIDQSGTLRTLGVGKATVSAWIEGRVVSVAIEVTPNDPGRN